MRWNRVRWWLKIAGWSVAGLVAGWTVSIFLPESYTSEAMIQIVPAAVYQELLPHDPMDVNSLLERVRPAALSRSWLTTIVINQNLYPWERASSPMEDVVEELRRSIRIDNPGANRIRIAFTYSNRLVANKVTQDLTSRLISESATTRTRMAAGAVQFFQDEVDTIGESWARLNARAKAIPATDASYEVLGLAREQERKRYESVAQKLGTAKMLADLANRGQDMRLELLDPATLPQHPNENHAVIMPVGLACGFGIGLLVARLRRSRESLSPDLLRSSPVA